MSVFDEINRQLGLQPMTPSEMNKIHFQSGEHSDVSTKPKTDRVSLKNL